MINSVLHLAYTTPPTTEVLYQGADARQLWKPPGLVPLPEKRRSKVCKLELMRTVRHLQGCEVPEEMPRGKARRGGAAAAENRDDLTQGVEAMSLGAATCPVGPTYRQLKDTAQTLQGSHALSPPASTYQAAKRILRGVPGPRRVVPGFERCGRLCVTVTDGQASTSSDSSGAGAARDGSAKPLGGRDPPFVGWIATGREWESFEDTGALSLAASSDGMT